MASSELHPVAQKFAEHVNPSLVKLLGLFGYGRVFERAEGVWIWDHEGRKYLDCLAGFGSNNLGHAHPKLITALHEHLDKKVLSLNHIGPSGPAADLAEALAKRAGEGLTIALLSSTGGEAVESGLKLARAATRRQGFVYCQGGYHGTGLGPLSVMGGERWRAPFEPLLQHCEAVPFGDLAALDKALAQRNVAAFLVEPIQGEGGVILPPANYLSEAQRLCRNHGTLLVLDEVQTGIGRTGSLFAFQEEGFIPDVLVLGKALGGGMLPVSATLTRPGLHDRAYGATDRFDLHGSTFSGNALACAAAMATLHIVDDERLVAASRDRGERLLEGLKARLKGHPLVRDVRGRGLFAAIELGAPEETGFFAKAKATLVKAVSRNVFGQWLAVRLLERGIICQPAAQRWEVLRIEPPLVINDDEIDHVIDVTGELLDDYRDIAKVLKDATERLGKQFFSGWRF